MLTNVSGPTGTANPAGMAASVPPGPITNPRISQHALPDPISYRNLVGSYYYVLIGLTVCHHNDLGDCARVLIDRITGE